MQEKKNLLNDKPLSGSAGNNSIFLASLIRKMVHLIFY